MHAHASCNCHVAYARMHVRMHNADNMRVKHACVKHCSPLCIIGKSFDKRLDLPHARSELCTHEVVSALHGDV